MLLSQKRFDVVCGRRWKDGRLQQIGSCIISGRVSFCLGTEVSVSGISPGNKAKVEEGTDRALRMARDNDIGRSNMFGSHPHVSVGTSEIFTGIRNEDTEREKCRANEEGISQVTKEILGDAHLGKRIFCEYRRSRSGNNKAICKQTGKRASTRRAIEIMARRKRMTLS
jgi:hypothetical protein